MCFPQSASWREVKVAYIIHVDILLYSFTLYLWEKIHIRVAKAVDINIRRGHLWCGAAEYGVVSGSCQITNTNVCGIKL